MAFPLSPQEHEKIQARIDGQEELIVAAAVKYKGGVVSFPRPSRHIDPISWLVCMGVKLPRDGFDCGFLTNRGRFVDRVEAGKIVLASGQGSPVINPDSNPDQRLYSEDMWLDDMDLEQGPIDPGAVF